MAAKPTTTVANDATTPPRVPSEDAPLKSGDIVKIDPATKQNALAINANSGFEEFAGEGFERVSLRDVLIPRLSILQKLSPQLSSRKADFIKGAQEGQIADVGMGEVFPDGILFVPVHYVKVWIEWYPRQSGRGIAAIHGDESILSSTNSDNERRIPMTSTGNSVLETAQWYGLNLTSGGRKCFIAMQSTQLRASRRWMNMATGIRLPRADGSTFQAPIFFRSYFLTTAIESRDDNEWFGWRVAGGPSLPELQDDRNGGLDWQEIRDQVIVFRKAVMEGEMKADVGSMADDNAPVVDAEKAM